MKIKPLVTILCITYNQKKFIAETIDSFLQQKTNFGFEIIIHDDNSTDGTTQILTEYGKTHPDIVKINYEKENQFSKGNIRFVDEMFRQAKGDYIALCEGDDYWTDPMKLQAQVNYLQQHPSHTICFHTAKIVSDNQQKEVFFPSGNENSDYTITKMLQTNFIATSTVMYRKQDYKNLKCTTMPNDWYLHLYHAQFGKIGFIDKPMAVYRRHSGGVWWESTADRQKFWQNHWEAHIIFWHKVIEMFKDNPQYTKLAQESLDIMLDEVVDKSPDLVNKIYKKYPAEINNYVIYANKRLRQTESELLQLQKQVNQLAGNIENIGTEKAHLKAELNRVINSKSWKLTGPLRKLLTALRHK